MPEWEHSRDLQEMPKNEALGIEVKCVTRGQAASTNGQVFAEIASFTDHRGKHMAPLLMECY